MPTPITRRHALQLAAATGLTLSLGAAMHADDTSAKSVKLAFIGVGNRGASLLHQLLAQDPAVRIPAICDIDEKALNRALDAVEKARGSRPEGYSKGPEDYRRLLQRDDINSVLIATPQELHAAMVIDSLKAGKFVGSEVPACCTVDECWDLVKAVEQTQTGYMMLENYLYPNHIMQVQNMADQGVFGDLTYAYGAYIHEIRAMRFNADGSLTWRGHNTADHIGIIYPTHAIGPACRWLGINKADKLTSLVCMASKSAAVKEYAAKKFGADSAPARINFKNGDTTQALIKTAAGRLIEVRYDTASPRPTGMGTHSLQGSRGAFESALSQRMVYIEGTSPNEKWEPLTKYEEKYQHARWKELGNEAQKAGHSGGDYFVLQDFVRAIRTGVSPIDVYDAVTWSSVRPLSAASLELGSKPVAVPDFRAPRQ